MDHPKVHRPIDLGNLTPPTVREKLLHKEDILFTPQAVENKDVPDEAWLSPIMSDLRRMPIHTALAMAEQIVSSLKGTDKTAEVMPISLALALSKWARGVQDGDNDTQGKA